MGKKVGMGQVAIEESPESRGPGGDSEKETERWGDRISTDSTEVWLRTSWVIYSEDRGNVNGQQWTATDNDGQYGPVHGTDRIVYTANTDGVCSLHCRTETVSPHGRAHLSSHVPSR